VRMILCALNLHRWPKAHRYWGDKRSHDLYDQWTPSSCGVHEHRYCERCNTMEIRYDSRPRPRPFRGARMDVQ
jgi:hypothetical protein